MIVKKVRLKLKWAWNDLLGTLGVGIKLNGHEGEVRVLCFHGVCEDHDPYINGRFIRISQLRELLTELKKHVQFLSAEQFERKELDPQRLNVLLTFDDGYMNNNTHLLPLLEEINLPALIFITGETKALWMDLFDIADHTQLSLDQLREVVQLPGASSKELKQKVIHSKPELVLKISELLHTLTKPVRKDYKIFHELLSDNVIKEFSKHPLIAIGNHTYSHFSFPFLSTEEMTNELSKCEERLEQCLIEKNGRIALPFAHYNSEVIDHLKTCNYSHIFVDEIPLGKEEKIIPRLTANPFISIRNQIHAINNGKY